MKLTSVVSSGATIRSNLDFCVLLKDMLGIDSANCVINERLYLLTHGRNTYMYVTVLKDKDRKVLCSDAIMCSCVFISSSPPVSLHYM